jgi:hypothetical protein
MSFVDSHGIRSKCGIFVMEHKRNGSSGYVPTLAVGDQVRLLKRDHRNSGRIGTVIGILTNPTRHSQHQWYDVKFENGRLGRFLERDLEQVV